MKNTQILVVEDENIVAMDIQNRLRSLGYAVPVLASSGEEAIRQASANGPDLVLMDIRLKGEMDGIEAAQEIQAELGIPVVYLTAYADEATLQRAKVTAPYGYLLKPFEERELHTTIEMALYKHRVEKQIKENERWLATTLKSICDAVIATDEQGLVKLMNPVAETLTGWKQTEALGHDLTEIFKILDEASRHASENPVTKVLQDGVAVGLSTHLLIARDGSEIPIDDTAAPIQDDRGEIIGVVLTFRDISEERTIQKRIQRQEQLAAVGQLAGGIAHEFNNILTSIIGCAELATSRVGAASIQEDLTRIVAQGQRAANLVRQIMDFSRKSIVRKRSLDLIPFLEETVILLKHAIPENNRLTLEIGPGCEGYMLEADPAQIQQALTNIVINATEAMAEGGTVQIRLSPLTLKPGERPPYPEMEADHFERELADWIVLSVSDTGVGISPEHLPRIFEPFFTTKEVGEGSGLGLAQVYGIIKQHSGHIDVDSREGQGTTITCYLPVATIPQETLPTSSQQSPPQGCGETLLLVEEQPVVREVACSMLEHLGYRVLTAADGRQALEIYEGQPDTIALVVTDVMVPETGGIALAQTLAERDDPVKFVALTAYPLETEAKRKLPPNIVDYLPKPWNLDQLAQTIQRCLVEKKPFQNHD